MVSCTGGQATRTDYYDEDNANCSPENGNKFFAAKKDSFSILREQNDITFRGTPDSPQPQMRAPSC